MLRRLRCYDCAATAAILATIPWSLGWLIGLPFGIRAIIVLGRPEVVEGFLSDTRQAGSGRWGAETGSTCRESIAVAAALRRPLHPSNDAWAEDRGRGLSRCITITIKSPVPGPSVNYPGEAR
jgi:hypothetical protein